MPAVKSMWSEETVRLLLKQNVTKTSSVTVKDQDNFICED